MDTYPSTMEMTDIVDEQDTVVGQAPLADILTRALPHRIVHILIWNAAGKLALQKRSEKKKFLPGAWSTSVGGHVQAGETYEAAALRESQEEIGAHLPLQLGWKDWYPDEKSGHKWLTTFQAMAEGPFLHNEEEVAGMEFFSLAEIQQKRQVGELFHPELLFLLKKHFSTEEAC